MGPRWSSDVGGDGPPRVTREERARARPVVDLAARQLGADSVRRRQRELADANVPVHVLLGPEPLVVSFLVRRGQDLYSQGWPVGRFRELILAVRDARDQADASGSYAAAWRAVRKWEALEPGECHVPMPLLHFQSVVGACLVRGMPAAQRYPAVLPALAPVFAVVTEPPNKHERLAAQCLLGFGGALRPGEGLGLYREDLAFATELGYARERCFIRIRKHKGQQRGFTRAQHATVRDEFAASWLRMFANRLTPGEKLWPWSDVVFRDAFTEVLVVLGLSHCGFVPSSLRAGAATALYLADAPVADISWALRHRNPETLRYYVQELGAALARAAVSPETVQRLRVFAAAADQLLRAVSP